MSIDLKGELQRQLSQGVLLDQARTYAADYLSGLGARAVYPSNAAIAGLDALDTVLPSGLGDAAAVLAALHRHGSPATTAQGGGRYFGFVNGGVLPVAMAARWLADTWDQNAALGVMSPVAARLEEIVERWLAELLGLPRCTAVGLVSGTSTAIICGLAAARWRLLEQAGWDVNARGLDGAPRIRIVTGRHTHSAVVRAIALLGFGTDHIEYIDVDDQGRVVAEAMPVFDDRTIVILQAGNVNSGSFDPFRPLVAKAVEARAWVHVDGAFGLWAAASPTLRHLTEGMAGAQSFSADAHKTLNVPYDNGVVLTTDREALVSALQAHGAYLSFGDGRDGMSHTPEMSRRARAVELWAALAWLGREGVAELVDMLHDRALSMAHGLEAAGFDVLNDVVFNQVIVACGEDALTRTTLQEVQKSGVCWAGGSEWFGRAVIRISICSWATTEQDIEMSVEAFRAALQRARHNEKRAPGERNPTLSSERYHKKHV